jgi:hypothetical protein
VGLFFLPGLTPGADTPFHGENIARRQKSVPQVRRENAMMKLSPVGTAKLSKQDGVHKR